VRHLRDDTVLILDAEVRIYCRERSLRWQAAFSVDGKAIRISTGKKDLDETKDFARDTYPEYKFRHKNDLPVITKKFADVARLAIADMRKQLDAGLGKKVYADYIVCIERYLIPYFGWQYVTSIDYEKVQSFYEWRRAKMGREPTAHPTQLSRWIHTVNPISPFMQQSRVAFLSFRKCANRNKEMGTGSF